MKTETTTWSEFPNGGKVIVEEILASESKKKSKRVELWESQPGILVEKLHEGQLQEQDCFTFASFEWTLNEINVKYWSELYCKNQSCSTSVPKVELV